MPKPITEPLFVARHLCWDIHVDGPETTFWVNAATFKHALGLRPRASADDSKAQVLARKNWAVLELIARDALGAGQVISDSSKGWKINHTIDDGVFRKLMDKYRAQITF